MYVHCFQLLSFSAPFVFCVLNAMDTCCLKAGFVSTWPCFFAFFDDLLGGNLLDGKLNIAMGDVFQLHQRIPSLKLTVRT